MKKKICILLFFLISLKSFAQDEIMVYYFNKCISLLGQNVPNDFHRMNRTMFNNDESIVLVVEKNLIIVSSFGSTFDRNDQAVRFSGLIYTFLEDNNWIFHSNLGNNDIYFKNGIYACILETSRREDGSIVAMVMFSKNINDFYKT